MPMPASVTIMLVPPKLMNGTGTPVSGSTPSTPPKLSTAWPTTSAVMPAASRWPNGSFAASAIEKPAQAIAANPTTTASIRSARAPRPTIARIRSVCASGR